MSSPSSTSILDVYYCKRSLVGALEPLSITPFVARSGIQHFVSIPDAGEANM